jgi:hypothetical protein
MLANGQVYVPRQNHTSNKDWPKVFSSAEIKMPSDVTWLKLA